MEDWGLIDYLSGLERQHAYVQQRIAGLREDTLIFAQHPPVYVVGSAPTASEQALLAAGSLHGIPVVQARRGGGITYHGPGQLMIYPIIYLGKQPDLHKYLRHLEQLCLDVLATLGVSAQLRPGLTGVWIGTAKIAAIGIAVHRGVAYHGIALNNSSDLAPFDAITPCRIPNSEGSVTRLCDHGGGSIEALKEVFEQSWKGPGPRGAGSPWIP